MSQLEDEIADVLNKTIRGLGKNHAEVVRAAGLDEANLQQLLDGAFDESSLRKLASALNLDADALVALPGYLPDAKEIYGVKRLIMPFRSWSVNAWLLELDGVSLLFDTGWNSSDILTKLDGTRPEAVFITHSHEDHVGGIESLKKLGMKIITENEALQVGGFHFGKIGIKAIDLSGHCVPTASYLVTGFEKPLWIVGDAIFAGSMGGCKTPENFQMAMATLRRGISGMKPECLILSGHGPITSVGAELASNPFHQFFS